MPKHVLFEDISPKLGGDFSLAHQKTNSFYTENVYTVFKVEQPLMIKTVDVINTVPSGAMNPVVLEIYRLDNGTSLASKVKVHTVTFETAYSGTNTVPVNFKIPNDGKHYAITDAGANQKLSYKSENPLTGIEDVISPLQAYTDSATSQEYGILNWTIETEGTIASQLAQNTNKLNNRVRWKTPQDYGCVGDGVTDDSIGFKRFLTEDTHLPPKVTKGTYLINTSEKLPLPKEMHGEGRPLIKFTHKDGGFVRYKDGSSTTYTGFGDLGGIDINGSGTTDYLITCGLVSEGVWNNVRLENAAVSLFKIDTSIGLVFFNDCIFTNAPRVFTSTENANMTSSINNIFVNGGNIWNIKEAFIETMSGGSIEINGAWMERVNTILDKQSSQTFRVIVKGGNFSKTQYQSPIFKLNAGGVDFITLSDIDLYFGQVTTPSLFHIRSSTSNSVSSKILTLEHSRIRSGSGVELSNILTADVEITGLNNIKFNSYFNDISYIFTWWNDLQSKVVSGVVVKGWGDLKSSYEEVLSSEGIRFNNSGYSKFAYDNAVKQHFTTDDTGINKYHFLISKSVTTANRPTGVQRGYMVYDQTVGKPIWWNGFKWIDSSGADV